MARPAVVNDLSFDPVLNDVEAEHAIERFVELLLSARKRFKGLTLVSHRTLPNLSIGNTFPIARWIGSHPANQDRWRAVRALADRAPYSAALSDSAFGKFAELEAEFQGRRAIGLGLAAWLDTISLSALSEALWDTEQLGVLIKALSESPEPGVPLTIVERIVNVRHAGHPNHLATHEAWWRDVASAPETTEELWRQRGVLFPSLRFLPIVERQLIGIGSAHPWFLQACDRFRGLQQSAEEWNPQDQATPQWRSHITRESAGRRHLCDFTDLDGEVRCFDLHARMTPGAGRVHFRLDRSNATIIIAYIGPKLGI